MSVSVTREIRESDKLWVYSKFWNSVLSSIAKGELAALQGDIGSLRYFSLKYAEPLDANSNRLCIEFVFENDRPSITMNVDVPPHLFRCSDVEFEKWLKTWQK